MKFGVLTHKAPALRRGLLTMRQANAVSQPPSSTQPQTQQRSLCDISTFRRIWQRAPWLCHGLCGGRILAEQLPYCVLVIRKRRYGICCRPLPQLRFCPRYYLFTKCAELVVAQ